MTGLDRFMEVYSRELLAAVEGHPDEYAFPASQVPDVLARMRVALERGSFNYQGRALRTTCRTLGLSHTRAAIVAFVGRREV